jgi:hypothetical protein
MATTPTPPQKISLRERGYLEQRIYRMESFMLKLTQVIAASANPELLPTLEKIQADVDLVEPEKP